MNDEAAQTYDQLATSYLQQLQALAFEISVAMDAIARNAINNLQESVAKQEMLCAVLASLANSIGAPATSSERMPLGLSDNSVARKIQATTTVIQDLNLQYAALLKHSGRSIALLVSLCRTHTGQFQEAGLSRLKRQTWSCEM
jgi:hypothetical protein